MGTKQLNQEQKLAVGGRPSHPSQTDPQGQRAGQGCRRKEPVRQPVSPARHGISGPRA